MTLLLSPVTAYASVQPFLPSAPGDSGGGGGAVPLWPWGWGIVTSQATSTAFTLTDSYEVLTSKVTYIETSTPAGGPQSFVAFVNQNPTPATNKSYLYMDKDGVRQNIESNITFPPTRNTYTDPDNSNWPFPTYTSSDGTTFTAGTGTWVLPVLNVTLEPGALYEFGFLAGLQSNNGMTGVVYTDAGRQKLGYIQNDNNPSYSDETTQFDTKKLDPYLFRNPYAEPTSTGTFEDFVFRVQTYADLAAFNNALAGAQSAFASASANAGLGVGQIRPDLVTALGSAITSATLVPASGMRMWLQPDVDDLTKTLNDAVAALVPNGLDVDKTAPVSSSDATATYESAPATITITATDEEGGSGVAALYYRLDDNATQTVSAAGTTVVHTLAAEVVASTDGTHTIEFWSTDNAENVESPHNVVTFHIGLFPDTTPPISICDADVSYIGAATITITATDTGPANQVVSGVDSITYTLNGGDPETVSGDTAVVTVAEDGDWILEFWATDNAENEEAPHNVVHFDVTIIDDPDEPDPEDMPITATVKDKHGKGAHGADGYSASDTVSCGMCHESRYPVGATSCTDEGCHRVAEARDLEPDEVNEDPPANHGYIRPNTYDCDGCHSVLSPTGSIERISGADRFATAIAVSKKN
ncbi:MAG: hypothetical protein FWE94_05530, partial [Coriobacteriia bacterium]|nr:hypothetical protein [Coriobacteriia bacterium]